ncbi:hypothetical protein PFICI_09533 [Pestalotiopsis fici W106-1]|uniref:Major facilitator superfamily (MFS) profile domain-containing protein n=1 Tax=Pestalotiopsis fici (strain W106-1 / CGMCC3.15140) TaxID=1229662 RepID=W3X0Q7_PESFW|nr:uncharacterized protein PFICI_09533 [Pestalotiopsis fici W106-1]ETS79680.1 hypothetical protein PFICI_09533 [Pestalotiopsis fici W106-1]
MNVHENDVGTLLGTWRLGDATSTAIVLQPTPSDDAQDPLNWTKWRKAINFGLGLFYVLITFVLIDIFGIAYNDYVIELGMGYQDYNEITALNYVGLAIGCVMFIPLVYKLGRRPVYLISLTIQLATAIWAAKIQTLAELYPLNFIQGIGGAISETIVQISISDLFFVHQYATMNGLFLLFQSIGAFLGPVAAGYVVVGQGWRWQWWWCAIFLGMSLLLVFLFFEETAYVPALQGRPANIETVPAGKKDDPETGLDITRQSSTMGSGPSADRSWLEKLRPYTVYEGSVLHHAWQPFILLFRVPAVLYTALTYGILLANFAVLTSVATTSLFYPPYNFDTAGVGLFNIAPFIGSFLASITIAPLSDFMIVRLSRKNGGIYESEMRLWPALPGALFTCGGFLMFGICIAQGRSWVLLALGAGIFGFGFVTCADIALSYLTDSYQNLIGDAIIGVIFVRNAISVIILFVLTPWIDGLGLEYMFVSCALITLVITLGFPVILLVFGKRMRQSTSELANKFSLRQSRRT